MGIALACPGCTAKLTVPDTAAGKRGKCPRCGGLVNVPALKRKLVCCACGGDASDRKATKDASENSYCEPCWKQWLTDLRWTDERIGSLSAELRKQKQMRQRLLMVIAAVWTPLVVAAVLIWWRVSPLSVTLGVLSYLFPLAVQQLAILHDGRSPRLIERELQELIDIKERDDARILRAHLARKGFSSDLRRSPAEVGQSSVWRDGKTVVMLPGLSLPPYCARCGVFCSDSLALKLRPPPKMWHYPFALLGLLPFICVYYWSTSRRSLVLPLCEEHLNKVRMGKQAGMGLMLVALLAAVPIGLNLLDMDDVTQKVLLFVLIWTFFAGLASYVKLGTPVGIRERAEAEVGVRGFSSSFLGYIPERGAGAGGATPSAISSRAEEDSGKKLALLPTGCLVLGAIVALATHAAVGDLRVAAGWGELVGQLFSTLVIAVLAATIVSIVGLRHWQKVLSVALGAFFLFGCIYFSYRRYAEHRAWKRADHLMSEASSIAQGRQSGQPSLPSPVAPPTQQTFSSDGERAAALAEVIRDFMIWGADAERRVGRQLAELKLESLLETQTFTNAESIAKARQRLQLGGDVFNRHMDDVLKKASALVSNVESLAPSSTAAAQARKTMAKTEKWGGIVTYLFAAFSAEADQLLVYMAERTDEVIIKDGIALFPSEEEANVFNSATEVVGRASAAMAEAAVVSAMLTARTAQQGPSPDLLARAKAAEATAATILFDVGKRCAEGKDRSADHALAMRLFRKAAELGSAPAANGVGWLLANGIGVPQDDAEAVRWYRRSADGGYGKAMINLGRMYESGRGVEQDLEEAKKLNARAAESGDAWGQQSR